MSVTSMISLTYRIYMDSCSYTKKICKGGIPQPVFRKLALYHTIIVVNFLENHYLENISGHYFRKY